VLDHPEPESIQVSQHISDLTVILPKPAVFFLGCGFSADWNKGNSGVSFARRLCKGFAAREGRLRGVLESRIERVGEARNARKGGPSSELCRRDYRGDAGAEWGKRSSGDPPVGIHRLLNGACWFAGLESFFRAFKFCFSIFLGVGKNSLNFTTGALDKAGASETATIPQFACLCLLDRILLGPPSMKLLSCALFAAVLTLGTAAYAQDQPSSQPKQGPNDPPKASIIGCLTKGSSDGTYLIADQDSGEKVQFNGPAQLDQYVNQTVKLTGTRSGKNFSPETIAQVSPSCNKAQ
jgi:hypothetical protein